MHTYRHFNVSLCLAAIQFLTSQQTSDESRPGTGTANSRDVVVLACPAYFPDCARRDLRPLQTTQSGMLLGWRCNEEADRLNRISAAV